MEEGYFRLVWLYPLPHFLTTHSPWKETFSATCHTNALCSQKLRRLTLGLRGGGEFCLVKETACLRHGDGILAWVYLRGAGVEGSSGVEVENRGQGRS